VSSTVLSIAFPYAPVGPHGVGGAEQILGVLDHALEANGQRSLLVACEGSETAGELFAVALPQCEVLDDADRSLVRKRVQAAIDRALRYAEVDLIHMHGMDFHEYRLPAPIPVVVTLHLPLAWYPAEVWSAWAGCAQFCCVSHSQCSSWPQLLSCLPQLRDAVVVENGVELAGWDPSRPREDYALAMGRICAEKNVHEALEAAELAGTRVLLSGQVFPYRHHQEYFAKKVKPLLAGAHEFLGPLPAQRRRELLSRARCLLHPTRAPETSSLVAMEALAAGTPVVAYRSGALTEIVEHGVTGYLVDGVDEMADAIRHVDAISPQACRAAAEKRFNRQRMVQQYFALYGALANSRRDTKVYA
jgi:glycosyltransferase involved in cell wall biosynthesis